MVTFLYATNERMRDRHQRLCRLFAAEIELIRSTEEEKGQQIANVKLKTGTEASVHIACSVPISPGDECAP